MVTAADRPSPAHSRIFRSVVRCSPCPAAVSSERLAYVALMKRAAATFLPEQVCGLEVAEMTAVVPTSQITLDVMAAHLVLGNRAAPIPQSVYGLGPEPGSLLELSATALPAISAAHTIAPPINSVLTFIDHSLVRMLQLANQRSILACSFSATLNLCRTPREVKPLLAHFCPLCCSFPTHPRMGVERT